MASPQQSPTAVAQSPPPPAPTTVLALGDDLLCEIFDRLPSLPSLVRAAFSCSTFLHAVRSSPSFRRRFRAARPPPLLGFFFDPDGPAIPTFAPIRRRSDPDHAAVVRGADFFLTRIPDDDDDDTLPLWCIEDCRDGYVLLQDGTAEKFAAYNPLTRALDLIPGPPDEMFDDSQGNDNFVGCFILSTEKAGEPLRLVFTCHDESRARAAVFSSGSREWQIFPWSEPVTPHPEDEDWLKIGRMVNGFVYWIHANEVFILVLNTVTLEFSQMDLPPSLVGRDLIFRVGENKDRELCIVCPIEFDIFVWVWRAGPDGIQMWMFDKRFPLKRIVEFTKGTLEEHGALKVVAVIGGYVYFSTTESFDDARLPCWFLSLCMETEEVDRMFLKNFDSYIYPYVMAWPPSLIDNNLHPQLEGA